MLDKLPTPCLLVDQTRLAANARRLARHLAANGAGLRLHVKTCKNVEIARMGMEAETGPITVSTLAEAEYFAANGMRDIIYAVGISQGKLERVLKIRESGARLMIILDNMASAGDVAAFGRSKKHSFDVLIEIDCDGHRGGVPPDSEYLLKISELLNTSGQNMLGVLTHAGSAYDMPRPGPAAFAELAEQERSKVVEAAQRLRNAGFPCDVVSAGSSPTAVFGENYDGLTEVRAGVFIFNDCVMESMGVCEKEDIALSVLCAVIGRRAKDGAIIVDAGWTSLSTDRGVAARFPTYGYGLVCGDDGMVIPHLRVWELNQEHGVICPQPGYSAPDIPIGSLLRILPVHACATASCFDNYHLINDSGRIATLARCRGW